MEEDGHTDKFQPEIYCLKGRAPRSFAKTVPFSGAAPFVDIWEALDILQKNESLVTRAERELSAPMKNCYGLKNVSSLD